MSKESRVRIWREDVVIPTYLAGQPNRNPMFLEKRVYQGSSGRVYPYPVIDRIGDERVEEAHPVVFLENEYLKLMVMPRFGGRIQYAYDKTNNYPFIYHNRVIKPALVGLAGPWLSGGIEFNWPQHHRPGTYCPVDYAIANNRDGSMTLWLSEIEPMWRLKGTIGLRLYPGKAFLEITIRLFNPTALPQSFHLWTNPAVHVNDEYQSVFPPDVQAVYDHGKRDVSSFPIARGEYYKVDYSKGVDISWYKNLPVPTSYMAARSDYDFVGGYDHGKHAGVLHVADHHVVPGKKQWVWGCGDFGQAWDRNLTDADGPYAELMCGVFADNQPDFSWLQPYEEKEVRQYFLPYRAIGYVRNATIDAAVSMEIAEGEARLGAYATSERPQAVIRLCHGPKTLWEGRRDLAPDQPFRRAVKLPRSVKAHELEVKVFSGGGRQLVDYRPERPQPPAIPQPAKAIPEPRQLADTEALYLAGLHLEQYRHATREPEDYYREALRRAPDDLRSNNALGLLLLRRGQFAKAEPLFRAAIESGTRHNPNPRDGESHYNLGICLRYLRRPREAFEAFYKASWNGSWQDAAFFHLAQLAAGMGRFEQALEFIDHSLARNANNQKATHLKLILLRKSGRTLEALQLARRSVRRDPLDTWARAELWFLNQGQADHSEAGLKRGGTGPHLHTDLEIASAYADAGAFDKAMEWLKSATDQSGAELPANEEASPQRAPGHTGEVGMPNARPLLFYFLGDYAVQRGDLKAASDYFKAAAAQNPERCFPSSLESILALQTALKFNPKDANAAYFLGNLWYDKRQHGEATACWEAARQANPRFPTVHRNLALAYFNKQHSVTRALRSLERAFALDLTDSRVLFELDLLKKRAGIDPGRRLAFLKKHLPAVLDREDLLLAYIELLNFFGHHAQAVRELLNRKFHPWEGGEGKVTGQYVIGLVELAKELLLPPGENRAIESCVGSSALKALELLRRAQHYPVNLGEGKLHGAQENPIFFWLGVAHQRLGNQRAARDAWEEGSTGMKKPTPAVYYNDQNPETIFYQGLCSERLGRSAAARERFKTLIQFGKAHLKDRVVIDYFAVSLPEFMVFDDDLDRRNEINCRYLLGLGYLGLGRQAQAGQEFARVRRLDPAHLGVRLHTRMLAWFRRKIP